MKKVQILGPGCPRCRKMAENTEAAVRELGLECTVDKVTTVNEIAGYGVMVTPALVVDGEVKAAGKVLSVEEIKRLLA